MSAQRVQPVEVAVLASRWAIREGATEAEAYVVHARGYQVRILAGKIEGLQSNDDVGIGIRVAVGKKIGFAYTTGLDLENMRRAVRAAVKQAKVAPEDPEWQGLPEPSQSYPEPGNMYSPELAAASAETVIEHVREIFSIAGEYEGVSVARGSVSVERIERAIVNTNGVYRVDVGTVAATLVGVNARKNGVLTPVVFDFEVSRVSMPSAEVLVRRVVDRVLQATKLAKGVETGKYTVVLAPSVFEELLGVTVLYSLRGDIYVQGRSYYGDKVGEQALSEKITIIDDGTLKGGDNTWRFDGEGVATSRKVLVEKGVVKGFVFDNYWGRRAGNASTGNAVRIGYSSMPIPGFTNVVVEPGDALMEELFEGKVLVVYQVQGAHTANSETGEYSVLANPAIYFENGEPKGWVRGAMISGNFYRELRDNVELLGKTVERAGFGRYAPWIRLSGITVAVKA
ncbi:TldD/PmbA family protein [Hyperthermus butylicus]|uniref:Zn-dependent protease, TldD n=1 Tax=Hyperthermus butylicus (strain DSM 5456 / JCM 9403 / PLM1-5) TaxID=415426 RepID=A2BJW4_HYPBU|nr:TldD/PmbA family protein [Hyperthermus butylicus]ABM80275.1 putative Zn-dependent protease, TldD [Hyperthermus butylicus DSM 5456]